MTIRKMEDGALSFFQRFQNFNLMHIEVSDVNTSANADDTNSCRGKTT